MTGPKKLSQRFIARVRKLPVGTNAFFNTGKRMKEAIVGPHSPQVVWVHEYNGVMRRKVRDNKRGIYIITDYDKNGRKKSVTVKKIEGRFSIGWPELSAKEAHRTLREMGRKVRKHELRGKKK